RACTWPRMSVPPGRQKYMKTIGLAVVLFVPLLTSSALADGYDEAAYVESMNTNTLTLQGEGWSKTFTYAHDNGARSSDFDGMLCTVGDGFGCPPSPEHDFGVIDTYTDVDGSYRIAGQAEYAVPVGPVALEYRSGHILIDDQITVDGSYNCNYSYMGDQ